MNRDRDFSSKTNTKKRRGNSFVFWIIFVALVFFGVGFLSRSPKLRISLGEISGNAVVENEEIHDIAQEYFTARFLFPINSRLWFSHEKFKQALMSRVPRIGDVDTQTSSSRLAVHITERQGIFLWCGNELVPVSTDSVCFFADEHGFVFDEAPYFSGSSYMRLYGGLDPSRDPVGQTLDFQLLTTLRDGFVEVLKPFGLEIQGFWFWGDDMISILLTSNNEVPRAPRVHVYKHQDFETTLFLVSRALSDEETLLAIRQEYDRLEYLDLRFKNQFIYKFFDTENTINTELPVEDISQENEHVEQDSTIIQTEENSQNNTEG